jgi:hypothetical protein
MYRNFWFGNLSKNVNMEDLEVEARTALRWILDTGI